MKYSSRFFLYAPLGVFLLLLAIAGIHWWILASRLGGWLDSRNGHAIMPGVTMAFDARRITGFPFSLDTEFTNLRFTAATPLGPTEWRSERFAMHGLTYGRDETIFEAAGHQVLTWTRADGSPRRLEFAVGSLRASAIEKGGALERFDLDLVGFGSKALTAQRLQFHERRNGADGLDIFLEASGLRPAAQTCPRLGGTLAFGLVEGRLSHAQTLTGVLSAKADWVSAVAGWRGRGGAFETDRLYSPEHDAADRAFDTGMRSIPAENLLAVAAVADGVCGY